MSFRLASFPCATLSLLVSHRARHLVVYNFFCPPPSLLGLHFHSISFRLPSRHRAATWWTYEMSYPCTRAKPFNATTNYPRQSLALLKILAEKSLLSSLHSPSFILFLPRRGLQRLPRFFNTLFKTFEYRRAIDLVSHVTLPEIHRPPLQMRWKMVERIRWNWRTTWSSVWKREYLQASSLESTESFAAAWLFRDDKCNYFDELISELVFKNKPSRRR